LTARHPPGSPPAAISELAKDQLDGLVRPEKAVDPDEDLVDVADDDARTFCIPPGPVLTRDKSIEKEQLFPVFEALPSLKAGA
jgi:hypothetical protein